MQGRGEPGFSRPGDYLIFRAIRFPNRMNPYSLTDETFAETELRKTSRVSGQPTRIYEEGLKEGNGLRSGTLMVQNQHLFGHVGYGLRINDLSLIHSFHVNMNVRSSGYGKNKVISGSGKDNVTERIDHYMESGMFHFARKVNEVLFRVNPEDASFVFFSSEPVEVMDKDGAELEDPVLHKLNAIYLQQEWKKKFNRELPIYEYLRSQNKLDEFHYSKDSLTEFLLHQFKYHQPMRDMLPFMIAFEKHIKTEPVLLAQVYEDLKKASQNQKWGFYNTGYTPLQTGLNNFINKRNFHLNCEIYLAKALKVYGDEKNASHLAEHVLKELIDDYLKPKNKIYQTKLLCSHDDIHMRNFFSIAEESRKLLSEGVFNKYKDDMEHALNKIEDVSFHTKLLAKTYEAKYRKKYPKVFQLTVKEHQLTLG